MHTTFNNFSVYLDVFWTNSCNIWFENLVVKVAKLNIPKKTKQTASLSQKQSKPKRHNYWSNINLKSEKIYHLIGLLLVYQKGSR